jgi:hypothetical protein
MTARRVLLTCGIGCGALLLLAVGSCVGFAVWVQQPGDVLEPARLLDPGLTGYAEWTLRLEDPGTKQFVDAGLRRASELRRTAGSPLPPFVDAWIERRQREESAKDLPRLFPIALAWTMHAGAGGDGDDHLVSASLRGADHQLVLLDWVGGFLLRRAEGVRVVRHRDERIYTFPGKGRGAVVFIRDGDLFVATDEAAAVRAVDRLVGEAQAGTAGGDLAAWLARAPARPLRGAVTNARGEIGRLWRLIVGGDDPLGDGGLDGALGATLGGGFEADGSFRAVVDLYLAREDAVAGAVEEVRAALESALAATPLQLAGVEDAGLGVLRLTIAAPPASAPGT